MWARGGEHSHPFVFVDILPHTQITNRRQSQVFLSILFSMIDYLFRKGVRAWKLVCP